MDSPVRVSVACEYCRKRKRKCDGLRPSCSFCLARNRVCEYTTEKRVKRRVDPDYVRALEDQIAVLKEQLVQAQCSKPSTLSSDVVRDELNSEQSRKASSVAIPPNMTTAIEDVSALIWRMSIDSNGDASFIGPSGNFCFPVKHWEAADVSREEIAAATPSDTMSKSSAQVPGSDEVDDHLIDLFARFVNPVQQFVDPETLSQLRGNALSPGLRLVKTAALAAGALFADDPQSKALGEEAADVLDATALQLCRQLPELATIQALSIMSWRELGLEQHNMAWMYNSMCASLVLHLGLPISISPEIGAASPASAPENSPQERNVQDTRLRTLWSSVFLDRIATSLLGRNCLLPWRRIKAPSFLSAVGLSPSLDELAFDHQCRLWFIHDQYMDNIYHFDFSSLSSTKQSGVLLDARDQLHSFHRQIHPSLQVTASAPNPSTIYLHISYHTSYILIHRPYLASAAQNNQAIYRLAIRSVSTAATAIVRLLRLLAKVRPFDQIPPFIVHSVLTAAVTHLCNSTSTHQPLRSQATAHFRLCFRALLDMQGRWVKARRAVSLLRGLARRWRVMGALPMQHGFDVDMEFAGPMVERTEMNAEERKEEEEEEKEREEKEEEEQVKTMDLEGIWQDPWSCAWPWTQDNGADTNDRDQLSMSNVFSEVYGLATEARGWNGPNPSGPS
ncbi:uncharacterized protein BDV14DRAFT_211251 [Aspergillus stella-maris]|uniref:uncharacterized protein n=1 Tax=Aspergillus stella-maris TaxID=1810926 RepID=UPI003CCD7C5F